MKYNSQKDILIIPEYGRNLQNLVNYALTVEDRSERQKLTEGLIKLMNQISPQSKKFEQTKDRFWNHLMRIADYKLDVDLPEDVVIVKHEDSINKIAKVPYVEHTRKNRHYGSGVPKLIVKAIALEEGEKKQEFIEYIAAFMKLVYRTWNQNHYINDDTIKSDLLSMSDNKLVFEESMDIDLLCAHISFKPKKPQSSKKKKSKSHSGHKRRKY